jgi:hypothetical protein
VRRVVTWEWPEEMNDFLIFDFDDGPRPTTARSDYRLTPNTIPRRQLVASPPMDGSVDVELITPDSGENDADLPDLDLDSFDAPEIVLPDFLADDESQDPVDTLLGGVPEDTSFNTAEVRGAVQDLRTQFRTLARLLGVDTSGGQGQEGNTNLQQEAVREAAQNPQNVARAIANARSALNTIANATSGSTDPAAAQAASVVDTYNQQLDNFAAAAPVGVAGGVVTADAVSTAVGFNATQSPVAGTRGSGTVGGLTMKVKAPASAKAGKKATVRVTAQPSSAQGVIRIALLRNTGQRLQVIAAKQVKLRNGKATTRITVPKKAAKGSYTLMASLVPNTRSGSGITVQRPMRVR